MTQITLEYIVMKPLLIDLDYSFTDTFMIKELNVPYFTNTHHFHKDYEIVFVKKSSGKRIVGDHVDNFNDGDLVFVGPDLPHAWFNDSAYYGEQEDLLAQSVVVYLKSTWLERNVLPMPQTGKLKNMLENSRRGIRFYGETAQQISKLLSDMYRTEGLRQVADLFTVLFLMSETKECEFLAGINYLNTHSENETARLNRVYEYVMRNFSSEISLENAADVANMTANAFSRYFKKQTQKNFSQFVNEIRIGHACRLLLKKDLSVVEVCYESGYQSITNFNKFFRRITGKSPVQYRKDIRGGER